jgi:hypothetical protein
MNVFILNTGRCGSTTFVKACEHITNFTTAHESRMHLIGNQRLAYPDNHIEADNRLAWFLGRLEAAYGDRAIYVHLRRDPLKTARSFEKRYNFALLTPIEKPWSMVVPKQPHPSTFAWTIATRSTAISRLFWPTKPKK